MNQELRQTSCDLRSEKNAGQRLGKKTTSRFQIRIPRFMALKGIKSSLSFLTLENWRHFEDHFPPLRKKKTHSPCHWRVHLLILKVCLFGLFWVYLVSMFFSDKSPGSTRVDRLPWFLPTGLMCLKPYDQL